MPTKTQFDQFVARFELDDVNSSNAETNFLKRFDKGLNFFGMFLLLIFITVTIYAFLSVNFTDEFYGLIDIIFVLPS